MTCNPRPLFESHSDFVDQDFTVGRPSIASVARFLEGFAPELKAIPGFLTIRGYLRCYADNALTLSSADQPPDLELVANPKWKPFTLRAPKQNRSLSEVLRAIRRPTITHQPVA